MFISASVSTSASESKQPPLEERLKSMFTRFCFAVLPCLTNHFVLCTDVIHYSLEYADIWADDRDATGGTRLKGDSDD